MNKKLLIPAIIVAALIVGGAVYYFFFHAQQNQTAGTTPSYTLQNDQFSVFVPKGWVQVQAPSGAAAMVVNASEKQTNAAAQQINFRTYYSVSQDTSSSTLADYVQANENSLTTAMPGTTFSNGQEIKINGRDAYSMDMQLSQQSVNFEVEMVVIKGNNNDVWILALNTLPQYWDSYQNTFKEIADSFTVK